MDIRKKVFLGNEYDQNGEECVCIPRDYFGVKNIPCERCRLYKLCWDTVSQEMVDLIVEYIRKERAIREFWEEYGEELYQ